MSGEIDIAMVTWPNHPVRWAAFQATVAALKQHLAPTLTFHWSCSSESQRDPKYPWYGEQLKAFCDREHINLAFREGPAGLGENHNAAMRMGRAEYVLLVQDDWQLMEPLDLLPGLRLLAANPEIDLVRYNWPRGLNNTTGQYRTRLAIQPNGWRRFMPDSGWSYGDSPHLRRRSFMDKWGWYREGLPRLAAEGEMVHRLRRGGAHVVVADKIYFGHSSPLLSSVIDDIRPQGKYR